MRIGTFDKICGTSLLLGFIVVCLLGTGWIMNCVAFAKLDFKSPVKAEIVRGIGLFPPFGAVLGWVDIDDTPRETSRPVEMLEIVPVK